MLKNSWFSIKNGQRFHWFSLIFIDFSWIYYQFSVIFSQFQSRGSTGIGFEFYLNFWLDFHWISLKMAGFYYQIWFKIGFQTREIFHWIFTILLSTFHWLHPNPLFLFLSHFSSIFSGFGLIFGHDFMNWLQFHLKMDLISIFRKMGLDSILIRFGFKMDLIWFSLNFNQNGIILA